MSGAVLSILSAFAGLALASIVFGLLLMTPGNNLWDDFRERQQLKRERKQIARRIKTGVVVEVYEERPRLFEPNPLYHATRYEHWHILRLRPEIERWCNEFTSGWSYITSRMPEGGIGIILFDRPEDAVAFKMRWY